MISKKFVQKKIITKVKPEITVFLQNLEQRPRRLKLTNRWFFNFQKYFVPKPKKFVTKKSASLTHKQNVIFCD